MLDLASGELRPLLGWANWPDDWLEKFDQILSTIDDVNFPGGILPVYLDNVMNYYAIASDTKESSTLISLLDSFVGRTVTNFDPKDRFTFSDQIPLEKYLIDNGITSGISFNSGDNSQLSTYCCDMLINLSALASKSVVTNYLPRSTTEVIQQFDRYLAAQDWDSALSEIQFLRENLRLDAMNLKYLEVKVHSSANWWTQLVDHPNFIDICNARRPEGVTLSLSEALFWTHIHQIKDKSTEQVLQHFKENVLPNSGNLFQICPVKPTASAAHMFALAALCSDPVDESTINRLASISESWSDSEQAFFKKLQIYGEDRTGTEEETAGPSPDPSPIDGLNVRCSEPATIDNVKEVLRIAFFLNSIEAKTKAREYVSQLSDSDINSLLEDPAFRAIYDDMSGYEIQPISTWNQLITQLQDPTTNHEVLVNLAKEADSAWSVEAELDNNSKIEALVNSINGFDSNNRERLALVLPSLVVWLSRDSKWPNASLKPLYECIYDQYLLSLFDSWRVEDFKTTLRLFEALLAIGSSSEEHKRYVSDLRDALPPALGANDIGILLDLGEMLITYSNPEPASTRQLWGGIASKINSQLLSLTVWDKSQTNFINESFDLGSYFDIEAQEEEDLANPILEGEKITIYTLRKEVGQRSKSLLESIYPGVLIELIHDKVNSPRMENLAAGSDIFILCWTSAAHAATSKITELRPPNKPPLYPKGSGSSSIVTAVEEYLESLYQESLAAD